MRKEEADSRSPAHPNDSLGKLFLPQWLLLGINPPFQCCRSPKLQPSWRPSRAASLLPHPSSSSLIPSQKGPLSIRSTEITEEEHMEKPTVQHVQLQLSPKFRELSPQFPPSGNRILGLTSLLFLQLVLGTKMLESPQGTNGTGPARLQTTGTNGPNASSSFSQEFSPIQRFPNDNRAT